MSAAKPEKQERSGTHLVRFQAWIGRRPGLVDRAQALKAMDPRYPAEELEISLLSEMPPKDPIASYAAGERRIVQEVRAFLPGVIQHEVRHISVFGFGPIPLLMVLGRELSDHLPTVVYARHRDTEDWCWKRGRSKPLQLVLHAPPGRSRAKHVALLLSISGHVQINDVRDALESTCGLEAREVDVYELQAPEPSTDVIQYDAQVRDFSRQYRKLLGKIRADHGSDCRIHIFPALPLPLAIECGRPLIQADPAIDVYDWIQSEARYCFALTLHGANRALISDDQPYEPKEVPMLRRLDGPSLSKFKRALAKLVKESGVIRDLVSAANISDTRVSWDKSVDLIWSHVLEEANAEPPKLRRLMDELIGYREESPELAALRQELIRLQGGEITPSVSAGQPPAPGAGREREEAAVSTVLVLSAVPYDDDYAQLQTNQELELIRRMHRNGECRERFRIEMSTATTWNGMQDDILRLKPRIVHFAGHGEGTEGLVVLNAEGKSHMIPTQWLDELFKHLKGQLKCVVLNACETLEQARVISKYVPNVIGTSATFNDEPALAFAEGFYHALFHGWDYRVAFERGRDKVRQIWPEDANIPVWVEQE